MTLPAFILDHNFPLPIVGAFRPFLKTATLATIGEVDPGLANLDDDQSHRWRKRVGRAAKDGAPVLVDAKGNTIDRFSAAEKLRRFLELAGVKRAQLYEQTETRAYKRSARTHAELNLGAFTPMWEAIPELRDQ